MAVGAVQGTLGLSDGALNILESSLSWVDSSYVFPRPVKSRNPRSGVDFSKRIFGGYLKRSGIEEVICHTPRYPFAFRPVMRGGGDIRTVQELIGHSTIVMTMRYAHLSPRHLIDAVNKVALGENQSGTVLRGKLFPENEESGRGKLIDIKEEKWRWRADSNR